MTPLPPPAPVRFRIGRALPFGPNGEPSAIDKQPVTHALTLGVNGFEGDEQGDRRHHGGPEKALHHYPGEHYTAWRLDLPEAPAEAFRSGAFGENLVSAGLTEANVCIGDVFRLGAARIQVSQARQPCWKLNLRFGIPDMARRVQDSGRTGWYYRVLETGEVAAGAVLQLLERPHPDWPLARLLFQLYEDPLNLDALAAMATLDSLASSWRELAQRRMDSGRIEDWSQRLTTPAMKARQA